MHTVVSPPFPPPPPDHVTSPHRPLCHVHVLLRWSCQLFLFWNVRPKPIVHRQFALVRSLPNRAKLPGFTRNKFRKHQQTPPIKLIDWWAWGEGGGVVRCLVMEGPPNGVPTQRGGMALPTQHQAPVTLDNQWRAARNIFTKGRGGREKQLRLMCNHLWERQSRHCKHIGDTRALRACGAPHMIDCWPARLESKLHLATSNWTPWLLLSLPCRGADISLNSQTCHTQWQY